MLGSQKFALILIRGRWIEWCYFQLGPRTLVPRSQQKFTDSSHNGYHWKELVLLITKSRHMCKVSQARTQKPEFCECRCDSTASTSDENNTAKNRLLLWVRGLRGTLCRQTVLAVWCGTKELFSKKASRSETLDPRISACLKKLYWYVTNILSCPQSFHPIISPSSFIFLHHSL